MFYYLFIGDDGEACSLYRVTDDPTDEMQMPNEHDFNPDLLVVRCVSLDADGRPIIERWDGLNWFEVASVSDLIDVAR